MAYNGTVSIRLDSVLSEKSLADVEEHARNDGSSPGSMLHEMLVAAGFAVVSVDWRGRTDA